MGNPCYVNGDIDGIPFWSYDVGIPSITIKLYLALIPNISKAVTTTNGNYIFKDLKHGTYIFDVSSATAYPSASTPVTANNGVGSYIDGRTNGIQLGMVDT